MNELSLRDRIYNKTSILINESSDYDDINSCGVGGRIWKSSVVLASFLVSDSLKKFIQFENKNILEIGSGAGVCGLVFASLNVKKVYLTDRDQGVIELLHKNLQLNSEKINKEKVEIGTLDWNNETELMKFKDSGIDVIIGSDLLYSLSMVDGLVKALNYMSNKDTVVLFALANRGDIGGEYDVFFV
jgi:predicted nicotinamide N-methyase